MTRKKALLFKCVVNGTPHAVSITNTNDSVLDLIVKTLKETGNIGQSPSNWEIRDSDGHLINQNLAVKDAGITQNQMLFLSPRAGVGGNTAVEGLSDRLNNSVGLEMEIDSGIPIERGALPRIQGTGHSASAAKAMSRRRRGRALNLFAVRLPGLAQA